MANYRSHRRSKPGERGQRHHRPPRWALRERSHSHRRVAAAVDGRPTAGRGGRRCRYRGTQRSHDGSAWGQARGQRRNEAVQEGVGAAAGGGRRRAAAAQAERPRGDGVEGRPSTETSTIMQSWSHPKLGLCVCLECNSWPYHTYEAHSYGTYAVLRCVLPLTRILLSKSGVPRGSLWPAGTPINCALVLRHTYARHARRRFQTSRRCPPHVYA